MQAYTKKMCIRHQLFFHFPKSYFFLRNFTTKHEFFYMNGTRLRFCNVLSTSNFFWWPQPLLGEKFLTFRNITAHPRLDMADSYCFKIVHVNMLSTRFVRIMLLMQRSVNYTPVVCIYIHIEWNTEITLQNNWTMTSHIINTCAEMLCSVWKRYICFKYVHLLSTTYIMKNSLKQTDDMFSSVQHHCCPNLTRSFHNSSPLCTESSIRSACLLHNQKSNEFWEAWST